MDAYEFAWLMYALGSLGCGAAAWLLFSRFGREWSLFFCATVLALLLTPYAIDAKEMVMAPALFVAVFDGLAYGVDAIKPVITILLGVWLLGLVLSLLFLLMVRHYGHPRVSRHYSPVPEKSYPGDNEPAAPNDLLDNETPLRAIR